VGQETVNKRERMPDMKPRVTQSKVPDKFEKYRNLSKDFIAQITEYPENTYSGRGIVICGGGEKYFTCAWVAISMLRKWGCDLPVELWHLGPFEMDDKMRNIMTPLGVTTVDAHEVEIGHPVRSLGGWELNPFSMIHSSFEEIIFLDADNVVTVDPSFLFDTPQYQETGACFWPDFGRLGRNRDIWKICGIEYRDEPEFESGQVVLDKRRCWKEIQLTMHLNDHSDFYYKHVHGDKETYHMAWHMLGTKYSMPDRGIDALRATMCQHDFEGNRIFQHRNMDKWRFKGNNSRIQGFLYESECVAFLAELRDKWDGDIELPMPKSEEGLALLAEIEEQTLFTYYRVDHDRRTLEFKDNGIIGRGAASCEKRWYVQDTPEGVELVLAGTAPTCRLNKKEDGVWRGTWVSHERMEVELIPHVVAKKHRAGGGKYVTPISGKAGRRYVYEREGHDKRVIELMPDGTVGKGHARLESKWEVIAFGESAPVLRIGPTIDNPILELKQQPGGEWTGRWNKYERMPIKLTAVDAEETEPEESVIADAPVIEDVKEVIEAAEVRVQDIEGMKFLLIKPGVDHSFIELQPKHVIAGGTDAEKWWTLQSVQGIGELLVGPWEDVATLRFERNGSGIWKGTVNEDAVELVEIPRDIYA